MKIPQSPSLVVRVKRKPWGISEVGLGWVMQRKAGLGYLGL